MKKVVKKVNIDIWIDIYLRINKLMKKQTDKHIIQGNTYVSTNRNVCKNWWEKVGVGEKR